MEKRFAAVRKTRSTKTAITTWPKSSKKKKNDRHIYMKLYKGKALPKKRLVCWQAWILFAIIVVVGLIESP